MEEARTSAATAAAAAAAAGGGGGSSRSATPTQHSPSPQPGGGDSRFDCNVCLSEVEDPVVTLCGHLYCWSCLYRWLSTNHTCPVCKAGVTKENVIPLYGRGSEQVDPRTKTRRARGGGGGEEEATEVPGRPAAQRPEARPQASTFIGGTPAFMGGIPFNAFGTTNHYTGGVGGMGGPAGGGGVVSFSAGFGFFPSLFGLQFQTFTPSSSSSSASGTTAAATGGGAGGNGGNSTADEAQQAFLSKLLLMLGIFTLGVLVFC